MKKRILLTITMVFLCLFALGMNASAATYGDLTYEVRNGEVTITDCNTSVTSVTVPATINGYPVTSIGSSAFSSCSSLTSIEIPDSVTSIGYMAFYYCSSLEEITLPFIGSSRTSTGSSNALFGYIFGESSYTGGIETKQYYSSNYYTTYYIPKSLRKVTITDAEFIPYGAFYNCTSLENITISDNVTNIGNSAFYGCSSLTGINIPDGITIIENSTFYGCSSLENITIPLSVTSIGDSAFYNTGYYNNANNWEDNVLYIGKHLIKAKTSISGKYTVKAGTKTIANYAFSGCSSLTSIDLPDSVTNIGNSAFSKCSSLEEITLPFIGSSRTSTGSSNALFGYIFGESSYTSGLETKQYYSSNCYTTYYIPNSLRKVTITDAEIIPYGAFYNCYGIYDITINSGIKTIYPQSFYNCENLLDLTLPCESPKISNQNIFGGCYMLTIHGVENSKIHTYADKFLIDFMPMDVTENSSLKASAQVIEGKIVITVKPGISILSKFMPVALYDENNTMIDLMVIPTNEEAGILKIVFKNNTLAHHAKIFICNSYEDMKPLIEAEAIMIKQ